ncbi:hypothetical protein ACFQY5_20555 [Paeniroseomonas aquatica]|uniref:hypothetical protein n=1 Tax=Paeniroseomonas aquatica TaxID=373043 RepID=UPI003614AFEE
MFTLLAERGLPPTLMAKYCAERPARFHGLFPKKGRSGWAPMPTWSCYNKAILFLMKQ